MSGMKTRSMIIASAVFSVGLALHYGSETVAAIFLVGHVLGYQLHVLEVKLNKLLSERGLYVTDKELAD